MSHRHAPGPLAQHNKPFKTKHSTKGSLKKVQKGRVSQRTSIKTQDKTRNKEARKNYLKNQRAQAKETVLFSKKLGSSAGPPRIVAIVPLSSTVNVELIGNLIKQKAEFTGQPRGPTAPVTVNFPEFKHRMTFLTVPRDQLAFLDAAKVADIILFVINAQEKVDEVGEIFITLAKAQGLPSVLTGLQGFSEVPQKSKTFVKKQFEDLLEFHFPKNNRLLPFDTLEDTHQILRFLSTQRVNSLTYQFRPYVLVDDLNFIPQANSNVGTLTLCGYLRGGNLSANDLIHLPDVGDFQIQKIEGGADPFPFSQRSEGNEFNVLETSDENKETLVEIADVDIMDNEQNWGEEDDNELEEWENRVKRKVPKGTSMYQASWIFESDDEDDEDSGDDMAEDNNNQDGDMNIDDDSNSNQTEVMYDKKQTGFSFENQDDDEDEDDDDDVADDLLMKSTEIDMDEAEIRRKKLEKSKQHELEDSEFPDEVDTPEDVPARVRFQKYRGLKSFRTSPWDPKESLPLDYAKIFQFKNFKRTSEKIMEQHTGITPGIYVKIHVENVPATFPEYFSTVSFKPFVVSGLYKHEHKISVLHFGVRRSGEYIAPIKSKDELIFVCGFRRFKVNPIFSENSVSDKHKFERWFHLQRNSVATVFGPIMYVPTPVVIFKHDPVQNNLFFVGSGGLMGANPDRIILKKIILTGTPYKIHKRRAVIKGMFFNPDDIRWFKPVELWTKQGRAGHILDTLGTHGYMKCRFNGQLVSHDTICMTLYKRVYPSWGSCQLLHNSSDRNVDDKQNGPAKVFTHEA